MKHPIVGEEKYPEGTGEIVRRLSEKLKDAIPHSSIRGNKVKIQFYHGPNQEWITVNLIIDTIDDGKWEECKSEE